MPTNAPASWHKNIASNDRRHVLAICNDSCIQMFKQFASRHPGRTPESILHCVEVQDIPVKSYHTLFCPTYVLDALP